MDRARIEEGEMMRKIDLDVLEKELNTGAVGVASHIAKELIRRLREAESKIKSAREEALKEVLNEWNKPYGLTDGRKFIDRLNDMIKG